MTARRFIRTVLMLACVCAALWQAASFLEILSHTKGRPHSSLAPAAGTGLPSLNATTPADLTLSGILRPAPQPVRTTSGELLILTPPDSRLTDAEREALEREAARHRPSPPRSQPGRPRTPP
jgi:hypothetical protein